MKQSLALHAALALLPILLLGCKASAEQPPRPNIVFIIADDLGYTDLGVTGSDYYLTPNLDAFAKQSLVFTHGYANCANCAPTRAALMSGMYAPRTGVYTVGTRERGNARDRMLISIPNKTELDTGIITLAELLKDAGYATASMGKWHLGEGVAGGPEAHGFDLNVGGNRGGGPPSYFSPYRNPFLEDGPKGEYLTERLTREAADFIGRQVDQDKPFFLYLPLYNVHTPIQPYPEFHERANEREPGKHHRNARYASMVEAMDRYLGRLFKEIDDLGIAKDTIVVFTSDNGGHHAFTDVHPLRAGKGAFYEGGIRVPLFVRYPGVTEAGATCDEPVVLFDFYPTLAELAGAALPESQPVDGVSLMPVLKDHEAGLGREAIFWHFPTYLQAYAGGQDETPDPKFRARPCGVVRSGDWKLIEYFETGKLELFNLKDDVGEQNDLSKKHPEKTRALHQLMIDWRKKTNAPVPTEKNPKYQP